MFTLYVGNLDSFPIHNISTRDIYIEEYSREIIDIIITKLYEISLVL